MWRGIGKGLKGGEKVVDESHHHGNREEKEEESRRRRTEKLARTDSVWLGTRHNPSQD